MKTILSALGLSLLIFTSCGGQKKVEVDFIQDNIDNAVAQNTIQTDIIEKSGKILNPRTINADGSISYIPIDDWCSGFFPGSMWLTYNLTGDKKWLPLAEKYTEALDSVKYLKWHHDVGFMIGCSYLNGYRFADKKEYKDVIVEAAKSLSTRFRPGAGVIQSWDADKGWQGTRGWKCPVIIDNMMNLELLFEATAFSGDSTFYNIAVKHADTTMAHHFRPDNSCYHVVDYDPKQEKYVRDKQHKDMRTNHHGLADRLGHYTVIPLAIAIQKTRSISIRHRRCITSSLPIRTCRKTSFLTGITMLRTFRTNLVTLLQPHVRLLLCTNSTVICRAITIRKPLIRSWKASAHRLIAPKWVRMETLY